MPALEDTKFFIELLSDRVSKYDMQFCQVYYYP